MESSFIIAISHSEKLIISDSRGENAQNLKHISGVFVKIAGKISLAQVRRVFVIYFVTELQILLKRYENARVKSLNAIYSCNKNT